MSIETLYIDSRTSRKALNRFGRMWGVKRKWLGLESNRSYSRRILGAIRLNDLSNRLRVEPIPGIGEVEYKG